jgi:chorismate synthase
MEHILSWIRRRRPGASATATQRNEQDTPEILSGLLEGKTCGAPLCAVFQNSDARSEDYDAFRFVPRPGHADFTAYIKTDGANDFRGGGHYSGRLMAPLVFAGALCAQLLEREGIALGAHIHSIGPIADTPFDPVHTTKEQLLAVQQAPFPAVDAEKGKRMQARILEAAGRHDSVGGVVECCILGLPAGLGDPIFDGLENRIAQAVFGIPAVKGVEFGDGFAAACASGSTNNDAFYYEGNTVRTRTNHNGGILGGHATGMPVLFKAAFKPTPSIGIEQESVDLSTGEPARIRVSGRHDPCVVPRAVPCVEAAAAVALYDLLLGGKR